jgi:GDP-6-deoxy-D-talose 4-dehydrogenase
MNGKSILVTGASGFTGQYFLSAANNAGYRCIAITRQKGFLVPGAHDTLVADIQKADALGLAIKNASPDYIVHLAAISFAAHGNTSEIYQVNQIGTINLLDAIRRYAPNLDKVIVSSSAHIYGNATDLPITEASPRMPVSHYGTSKYAMELVSQMYSDLPIIITRPFNYTGKGQNPSFLIPKMVAAFIAKQKQIELGNLGVSRDFSDVRDVATAYLRLLETNVSASIYNICSGTSSSLLSIVNVLNSLAGYEIDVAFNPKFARSDEIITLCGSPSLLESAIGDYRKYKLADSLAWMLGV